MFPPRQQGYPKYSQQKQGGGSYYNTTQRSQYPSSFGKSTSNSYGQRQYQNIQDDAAASAEYPYDTFGSGESTFSADYAKDYSNEYFSGLGCNFSSYNNQEEDYGAEQEQYNYNQSGWSDTQNFGYESVRREAENAGFSADGIYVENESDFLAGTKQQRNKYGDSASNFGIGGGSTGVSPYFGIDPVETEPDEEEPEVLKTSAFMPGPWKPAAVDRDNDINSLTRDAQIVAGIRPDEPTQDFSDVAQEIEVTVPSDLLGPDMCKLCFVTLTSADMANAHYAGKKHAQRENQYVRKIYEEKGINVTRFVNKALTHITTKHLQAKRAAEKRRRFRFTCRLCHLSFVDQAEVDEHVSKPAHSKRVAEYQMRYTAPGGPIRGSAGRKWGANRRGGPGPFSSGHKESEQPDGGSTGIMHCAVCNKSMNSQLQWDMHINSKKHLSKATYM